MRQIIVKMSVVRAVKQILKKNLKIVKMSMNEKNALNNALNIMKKMKKTE